MKSSSWDANIVFLLQFGVHCEGDEWTIKIRELVLQKAALILTVRATRKEYYVEMLLAWSL